MSGDPSLHAFPTAAANPFAMSRQETKRYMEHFDVERWYHSLRDVTPRTIFLPLDRSTAAALVADYREKWNIGPSKARDKRDIAQHQSSLDELRTRIDAAIAGITSEVGTPVFARLSSRSPKDAGLCEEHPRAVEALADAIQRIGALPLSPNDLLRAVMQACGEVMKVRTGADVLELFRHSERVYTDLNRALQDMESEWQMSAILREWHDMDLEQEYRGIVCQGRLCFLLQYNDYVFYPSIPQHMPQLTAQVAAYYADKVASNLPHQHCIVDFCIQGSEVHVVEINPFGPATGIPFTSWLGNRALLQDGQDVWGDLAHDQVAGGGCTGGNAAGEGAWYVTQRHGGVMTRVAIAPPERLTIDYVEGLAPALALALEEVSARERMAVVPQDSQTGAPHCCIQ